MGGIETHCAVLLPRMVSQAGNKNLTVTVLARRPYVTQSKNHDGIRQIPLWSPRHSRLETIAHTFVAAFYARFVLRADCVHLHGIGPGLAAPLFRLFGLKLLFTHHGEDYKRQKWGRLAKAMLRVGEVLAVTFANRVITVSMSTAESLRERFPQKADRITHIPNGITPPRQIENVDSVLEKLGLTSGQYIITVGRLVPEKAQDDLVEAFERSELSKEHVPLKLLVVGAADHESDYTQQLTARANQSIIFAGRLPRDTVMALNQQAALFVLPSYHEGLSIAALEALFSEAPMLLSDIRPNLDIGLPEHHYFKTGSISDLSEKLAANYENYVVRNFDPTVFDWARIAQLTLNEFEELAPAGETLLSQDNSAANTKGMS
ncbi:glycosyltransferase family 4 protein [Shimia sediminis]|uniref:glycosyltransferase family 4 protein n=1 Tax=Shimia sediminis TaxID=2497945 RepID=UPI0013DEFBEF|nr:glycosyltransferase family 4 protein [Shimia sediminis]